jgi:hypothetical protein
VLVQQCAEPAMCRMMPAVCASRCGDENTKRTQKEWQLVYSEQRGSNLDLEPLEIYQLDRTGMPDGVGVTCLSCESHGRAHVPCGQHAAGLPSVCVCA